MSAGRPGARRPAISPVRTVHRLLGRRSLGLRYPERAGYWPSAAGLFAFVWLELASPDPGSLGAIKVWLLVYLVVTLAGTLCCGDRWCARADPFETYSMVASRLSACKLSIMTSNDRSRSCRCDRFRFSCRSPCSHCDLGAGDRRRIPDRVRRRNRRQRLLGASPP